MKAIVCENFCEPEDLQLQDIADPVAGPGEVLVEIRAAGLNFFDILRVQGRHQVLPELPFLPVSEFAGVVLAAGEGVGDYRPGDRVVARTGIGGAAEKAAVPTSRLWHLPDDIDFDRAAGLGATYTCAVHGLVDRGHAKAGETLVVLGAAGGTGIAAVEVGKALGLTVIACASSDEKLAFCHAHGADFTVNYATEDLKSRLKQLGGVRGIDLVYDPVGGSLSDPALRSLGFGGRFLVVGFASGTIPSIPLNLALVKSCDIIGVFQGRHDEFDPARARANMDWVIAQAAQGRLTAPVHGVWPLARAAEAMAVIARGEAIGKLVLHP
jgi:NADPH2:quinone reductase